MSDFKQGQEVRAIFFNDNLDGSSSYFKVGEFDVERITVEMENGQMAGVPWFAVWKEGKIVSKWNGALLGGVEL